MCAAFAPPLRCGESSTQARRSRSRSPSPASRHESQPRAALGLPSSMCLSPAGSPSGSEHNVPCASINDGGGSVNGDSTRGSGRGEMPTFTEIARGVIKRDARSTHDPFARARARILEDARREHEERQHAVTEQTQEYQRLLSRRKRAMNVLLLVLVVGAGALVAAPLEPVAQKKTKSRRDGLFHWGKSKPPPPLQPSSTNLENLAADMPAIASSKEELNAILELAGVKAKPAQIDRVWSGLVSGELRVRPGEGFMNAVNRARATGKTVAGVLLAGFLRNTRFSTSVFVVLVTMATCVMWARGGFDTDLGDDRVDRDERVALGTRSGGDSPNYGGRIHRRSLSDRGNGCRRMVTERSDRVLRSASSSPRGTIAS